MQDAPQSVEATSLVAFLLISRHDTARVVAAEREKLKPTATDEILEEWMRAEAHPMTVTMQFESQRDKGLNITLRSARDDCKVHKLNSRP